MEVTQPFIAKLEQNADLKVVRCTIADLIIHYLERSKAMNNLTALDHLINAAGSLTLNINAARQPSALGLKVCMADIDKAAVELRCTTEAYQLRGRRVEALTFDMLLETVRSIHERLCSSDNEPNALLSASN